MNARRCQSGFTIIEMAVVIAIVGLLLGAILAPLATQYQVRKNKETQRTLDEIHQALLGFAASQGRLPCPDTTGDGQEDFLVPAVPGTPCNQTFGRLPWQALQTPPVDAWGRVLLYRVTQEFANTTGPSQPAAAGRLDLTDVGDIPIITRGDDPTTNPAIEQKAQVPLALVPAVVLSTGANGLGGADLGGGAFPFAPAATDEANNTPPPPVPPALPAPFGTPFFVTRSHSGPTAPCNDTVGAQPFCEFDDLLIWVSTPQLMRILVETGQLP